MKTDLINLIVFDTKENFELSSALLGEEGSTFKKIICVEKATDFNNQLSLLSDDEYIFLVVHAFSENINGIKRFVSTKIITKDSPLPIIYISDGDAKSIKHQMIEGDLGSHEVYKYHQVQTNLEEDKFIAITKSQFLNGIKGDEVPKVDYCVITALYKDEFEQLKKVFDFPETEHIRTGSKLFYTGYLKSNKSKKIIAAIPNSTGMVDSSIIATLMLELFKPKYLLMSGVCGGSDKTKLGDIVVAKQIFTFQKGKLSGINTKLEDGSLKKLDLYDAIGNKIDYEHLYDENGNQVIISIEKFEKELETLIGLNAIVEDTLNPKIEDIKDEINKMIRTDQMFQDKTVDIHIEPMACSTMVINKEGFFDDTIKDVHRKTAAVEMESYGIARACQYGNDGKTIPIIFKSVMDKTAMKEDVVGGINYKKFAAYTSAQFMRCLFEFGVI